MNANCKLEKHLTLSEIGVASAANLDFFPWRTRFKNHVQSPSQIERTRDRRSQPFVGRIEELRDWGRQGNLLCQGCKQPVLLHAGEILRRHFAHQHLANCPYAKQSPRLLEARAVLYDWLQSKFGEKAALEKSLPDASLPRPIDCWVEREAGAFAYWILDSAMNPEKRESLQHVLAGRAGVRTTWVFLAYMLRESKEESGCVLLTTTERKFLRMSRYDETVAEEWMAPGQSLHYLDRDKKTLTTYRGLRLVHEPQMYIGQKQQHELTAVLVSPHTGEFVHPGEHERWLAKRKSKKEKARRELPPRTTQKVRADFNIVANEVATREEPMTAKPPIAEAFLVQDPPPRRIEILEKNPRCTKCGKQTNDWITYDGATNTCVCRECHYGKDATKRGHP